MIIAIAMIIMVCWRFKVVTFLVLDENRWSLWAIKVAEMSSFLFKPCHKGYCPWIEVVQGFYDPFLPTYIDDSNRVKALINFVFLITHSSIRVLWFNLGKLNRKLQWSYNWKSSGKIQSTPLKWENNCILLFGLLSGWPPLPTWGKMCLGT